VITVFVECGGVLCLCNMLDFLENALINRLFLWMEC